MDRAKIIKNIIIGFGGQFLLTILGIIIPRIIISSYGSDINGLLNTISQIFKYLALLEAGIGAAAKNQLYRPLVENNKEKVSYIASVASRYFRRITIYYAIAVICLALLGPIFIKSELDYWLIFWVIIFEGIGGVISFYFIQTLTSILRADGKSYVPNGLAFINRLLSYAIKIILALKGISIIILQFSYFIVGVGNVLFYKSYFKKHYKWIDFKLASKDSKLQDRNAYVLTEIAGAIFSSTDMIVLSTFLSTKMSSVYAIYNLVFNGLNIMLNSIYASIVYILGQTFHKDKDQYIILHDSFTSIFMGGMTIMLSTAYLVVLPFIHLYTSGITDIEYIYPKLPLLFSLVQLISWSRYVTGNLSCVAGYAKITSYISLVEAVLNILFSIIFVQKLGIIGVLYATVIALPVKVIFLTILSELKILKRNGRKYMLILGVNYTFFIIIIFISRFIHLPINNYSSFMYYTVIIFIVCIIAGTILNFLVNPEFIKVFYMLKKHNK